MNCELVQEKLSCYLDGVLDEATLEAVESHLEKCPECIRELATLKALSRMTGEIEDVDPPADLRASIREAVARDAVLAPCEEYAALLSAYVDGELSREDAETVRTHVEACSACARDLEMLRRTVVAASLVEDVDPPVDLREKIAAATTNSRMPASVNGLQSVLRRVQAAFTPARLGFAAASAFVTALVAVVFTTQLGTQPVIPTVKARPVKSVSVDRPAFPKTVAAVPEIVKHSVVKPVAVRRHILEVVKPVDKKPLVPAKDPQKPVAASFTKRQSMRDAVKTVAKLSSLEKAHTTPVAENAKVDSAPEVAAVAAKSPEEAQSDERASQPTRIRIQVADRPSQAERFERIVEEVKQDAARRKSSDDSIKVDFITISR